MKCDEYYLGEQLSFFPVDNTKSGQGDNTPRDPGVTLLRKSIVSTLENHRSVKEAIPMMWAKVADELIGNDQDIMHIKDVRELAAKWWVQGDDFVRMLNRLHQLGIIVHHDEKEMNDFVVTSPQLLLKK